jgi:uncharacterized membrane protein
MNRIKTKPAQRRFPRELSLAGAALGFGLGGFFDGILLHQVLQWHHLLSGLEGASGDLRFLVLTDGMFHLLMYVMTIFGLCLLWRTRRVSLAPGADRHLVACALVGFGSWHILDAVLSHWLLGLHRIRMDVANPLVWDLLWFALFGLVPVAVGLVLRKRRPDSMSLGRLIPVVLAALAATAGGIAAVPAPQGTKVMVVFWPGTSPATAQAGLQAVDGALVWADASEQLWAIDVPDDKDISALYQHGAILVSRSGLTSGCLDWFKV